jgi:hypothetical protein
LFPVFLIGIATRSASSFWRAAAAPLLGRLKTLDLAENEIGTKGAVALAELPHTANLTSLNLAYNDITDAGVQALAASPHLAGLVSLNLENNRIDEAGATALLDSPHLARLRSLRFVSDHNQIPPALEAELRRRFQRW